MVKYEDVIREIRVLENQRSRNEKRIKELNEQNNSITSSLKILNSKKEMFEKLDSDLETVMRKKKSKTSKKENDDINKHLEDENLVASNVYWAHGSNKHGF